MRILELDQTGELWKTWRNAGLGSSDAAVVMGVSPYMTISKLKAIKMGAAAREIGNAATRRGKVLEGQARELYHRIRGITTRPVCVIHDVYDWLRASLDGLSTDNRRILEIKAIKWSDHQLALDGKVPPQYWPQVQHQLLVTELKDLDYWSYSESTRFPVEKRLALVEVKPDQEYLERLFAAEQSFIEQVGFPNA